MAQLAFILMGLKHSGKTSLGRRLANELELEFIDLDDAIESLYTGGGLSCREIYLRHGRDYFLDLEASAAGRVKQKILQGSVVLSLGGGAAENPAAMAQIQTAGFRIYLHDEEEHLFTRIIRGGSPAFLPSHNQEEAFHEIYTRRNKLYMAYADAVVAIDGGSLDQAYSLLLATTLELMDAR